ncbi:MAG: 2-phospho-L-lactate guanylyltransferase [Gammaproteobacteria bacterium]|nr:2-phospho-L-lactate guanylyltransferase [Gammaproteobacteria bacterium]
MWAIVPYKGIPSGKSRLAEHLDVNQRGLLSQAMLHDVLLALTEASSLLGVIVSSPSKVALEDVRIQGIEKFQDNGSTLAQAITEAAKFAMEQFAARSTFIVPADIPLISSRDVDYAIGCHREVTIIPDDREIGTNGLICTPPDAIEYVFDGKSFQPHKEAALKVGIKPDAIQLPNMGHDIDTIFDLRTIMELGKASKTAEIIRSHGLDAMLEASAS